MKDYTAASFHCNFTSSFGRLRQNKKRAARLFFFIQAIKSMIYGGDVAVVKFKSPIQSWLGIGCRNTVSVGWLAEIHSLSTSCHPADLCLTGLQISTNQRAPRKCIWRSIHSRAFREGKFTVLRNSGILFLTVQHLATFAYDTHGQVKDMRLLKLNVLFMLR